MKEMQESQRNYKVCRKQDFVESRTLNQFISNGKTIKNADFERAAERRRGKHRLARPGSHGGTKASGRGSNRRQWLARPRGGGGINTFAAGRVVLCSRRAVYRCPLRLRKLCVPKSSAHHCGV